mmetsp:Transcript_106905/g.190012  ORF Transcript_106905/g.190012 Transcript_106905/m.190012 type:complete len:224 (+) Transcript_106905:514-1185(+)
MRQEILGRYLEQRRSQAASLSLAPRQHPLHLLLLACTTGKLDFRAAANPGCIPSGMYDGSATGTSCHHQFRGRLGSLRSLCPSPQIASPEFPFSELGRVAEGGDVLGARHFPKEDPEADTSVLQEAARLEAVAAEEEAQRSALESQPSPVPRQRKSALRGFWQRLQAGWQSGSAPFQFGTSATRTRDLKPLLQPCSQRIHRGAGQWRGWTWLLNRTAALHDSR